MGGSTVTVPLTPEEYREFRDTLDTYDVEQLLTVKGTNTEVLIPSHQIYYMHYKRDVDA